MPYCTSYFKFLFEWFWGFPEQNKDFAIQNMGERGGIILWALLTVFLVSMYIEVLNWYDMLKKERKNGGGGDLDIIFENTLFLWFW